MTSSTAAPRWPVDAGEMAPARVPGCRWFGCPEPAGIRGYCPVHAEKILDEDLDRGEL